MNAHKVRLVIFSSLGVMVMALYTAGYATTHFVEGNVEVCGKNISVCLKDVHYGLLTVCSTPCLAHGESCEYIDFKHITPKSDNDVTGPVVVVIISYVMATFSVLGYLAPLFIKHKGTGIVGPVIGFGMAGVLGLIGHCLFLDGIIDPWKNLSFAKHIDSINVNLLGAWAFQISLLSCAAMIVTSLVSVWFLRKYTQSPQSSYIPLQ